MANATMNVTALNQPSPSLPPVKGLLSDSATRVVESVLQISITPLLMLCGVAMNIINMAVFFRQGLSDRINLCLFSLATSDCGYVIFFALTRLHSLIGLFDYTASVYWKIRSMCLIGIYVGFLNTSKCLTLVISVERCVCVLWPLKARTVISTRQMLMLILSLYAVMMPCSGLYSAKYDMVTYTGPGATNGSTMTTYRVLLSPFYLRHADVVEAIAKVSSVVVPTVALTVVAVSTAIIVMRMRSVLEWRQRSSHASATASGDQRGEAAVTRMLVVICIMFTVCTLPYVARVWATLFVWEMNLGGRYHNVSYLTALLGHTASSMDSSFNFLIYFTMSTRFRHTLRQLMGRGRARTDADKATTRKSGGLNR